jgi:hypothetical protein
LYFPTFPSLISLSYQEDSDSLVPPALTEYLIIIEKRRC